MGNIGGSELLVILVVALLLLGPKRLPEVGEALGRTIRRFKQASRDLQDELDTERHLGLDRDRDAKAPAAPEKTQAREEKTEAP
jgi:TatA/E family protein of Tat protein translocase